MASVISLISRHWRWTSHLLLFLLLFGADCTSLDFIECDPREQASKDLLDDDTRRLMASSSVEGNSSSGLPGLQVEALMEFRRGVVQDPYEVFLNWDYSAGSNVCSWTGVSCANSTTGGVTALDLSNQQLSGTLSPSLAALQFLSYLDLSNNSLVGIIPDHWGALQNLAVLNLSSNGINGTIPSSISNCSSLTTLDLSKNLLTGNLTSLDWRRLGGLQLLSLWMNDFSGSIPETLGELQMLQYLHLSRNNLTGSIPTSLANCSALVDIDLKDNFFIGELPLELGRLERLKYLNLESNKLSGRIPSSFGLLVHLIEVCLRFNNLEGPIPAALGNCSSLEALDISYNSLSLKVPTQFFQLLSKLKRLNFSWNALVGGIDRSIGNCTALEILAWRNNHLSGSIPAELGLLKNLLRVLLFENSFTGVIPPEIGNCSLLFDLGLRGNRLTGTIPSSIGNLVHLQNLRLGDNFLTGSIPPVLANCTRLYYLALSSNQLSNPIPAELGQLHDLKNLNLSNNLLTGPIPSFLANFVYLAELDLANNKLTGPIPPAVLASLVRLETELNLSRNQLSGPIPREIGRLDSVQVIDLSFNNLSGVIPTALGSCRGLQSLNLSSNNLEGEIPEALVTLPSLNNFNVSFNRLTGAIPDTGVFWNFPSASFIGNPDLCGRLVDHNCSSRSEGDRKSCHEIRCHRRRIVLAGVVAFCVSVMIILGVIACYLGSRTRMREQEVPMLTEQLINELSGKFKLSVGDILEATGQFSEANIVGVGAKSTIYKGVLPCGTNIAVKKMRRAGCDEQSIALELDREVHSLGGLRHRNLLRIYGFCSNGLIEALVLEYMPNGSLWKQLHEENCLLNFDQRLDIAIGVAEALVYLHYECPRPIIHLDLKPGNILLNEEFVPKVADFGISRFVRDDSHGEASVSSFVRGTIGYIPPEYGASTNVSTKGDVYSFGVVLFELITRKKPTDGMFNQGMTFRDWVMDASPHKIVGIVDQSLVDDLSDIEKRLGMMLQVGLLCTVDAPSMRPTMKDVKKLLRNIKTLDNPPGVSPSK